MAQIDERNRIVWEMPEESDPHPALPLEEGGGDEEEFSGGAAAWALIALLGLIVTAIIVLGLYGMGIIR